MNVVKYLLVFFAVSFSIGLPAQDFSALDSIINIQINKHNTPGAVGLVINDDNY
jgi:hypothetical protein